MAVEREQLKVKTVLYFQPKFLVGKFLTPAVFYNFDGKFETKTAFKILEKFWVGEWVEERGFQFQLRLDLFHISPERRTYPKSREKWVNDQK